KDSSTCSPRTALPWARPTSTGTHSSRHSKPTSLRDSASHTKRLRNLSYAAELAFSTTRLRTRDTAPTSAKTILSFTTSTTREMVLTVRPSAAGPTPMGHAERLVSAAARQLVPV